MSDKGRGSRRNASNKSKRAKSPFATLRRPFNIGALVERFIQVSPKAPEELRKSLPGAIRARDYSALKGLKDKFGSPQLHCDPDSYFQTAQLLALFTKYPFQGAEEAAEEAAIEKFLAGEERCRMFNVRIRKRQLSFPTLSILENAGRAIDQLLGDFDEQRADILAQVRHGPGSTLCVNWRDACFYTKSSEYPWTATYGASKYFPALLREDPHLDELVGRALLDGREVLDLFEHDVIVTVPKTVWTKRTISKQTRLGVYLQLGMGEWLSDRLQQWRIFLASQEQNQKAAFYASISGEYATIDLSNASGSICRELVRFLLRGSPAWLDFLYDLRTPSYILRKGEDPRPYEMWSGMGNGYTFPLETMVFYAILRAIAETVPGLEQSSIIAYGDDLVIHSGLYHRVVEVFAEIGFELNETKSFHQGPFRESCGQDYWYGIDVRPTFLNQMPACAEDIYYLYNSLLLINDRIDVDSILEWLLTFLHPGAKLFGPYCEDRRAHLWAPCHYLHNESVLSWSKDLQAYSHRSRIELPKNTPRENLPGSEEVERDLVLFYQHLATLKQSCPPMQLITSFCNEVSGRTVLRQWSLPWDSSGEVKVVTPGNTRRVTRRVVLRVPLVVPPSLTYPLVCW